MNWIKQILDLIFGTKKNPTPDSSVVFTQIISKYYDRQIIRKLGRDLVFSQWGTKLLMEVIRVTYTGKSTIGVLYVNEVEECYTLEDNDRLGKGKKKIKGGTAIPEGTYNVKITHSKKFRRKLPIIQNVPGFRGIRIHPGNTDKDTEGCLLVGETRGRDFIGRSRKAFNKLFKKIEAAQKAKNNITITVKGTTHV